MSNNQTTTVQLNSSDLTSLIKSLSASDYYHKNLKSSAFSYPNELQSIIDNHNRIKNILKDSLEVLENLCPHPSETVKPALVAVGGGIL